jgi:hypothetical protein
MIDPYEHPIEELLDFDALDSAEKVTGKSYKEDENTSGLGVFLHISKSRALKDRLTEMKDTYMGMSWAYFREALLDGLFDFEEVWTNKFRGTDSFTKKPNEFEDTESLFVSRKRGIVLFAESYFGGESTNGGHCFMQYKVVGDVEKNIKEVWGTISSGFMTETNVVINSIDIREGLLYYLTKLDLMPEKEWQNPWVGNQNDRRPWILNYDETHEPERLGRQHDHLLFRQMILVKWDKMPQSVKEIIGDAG